MARTPSANRTLNVHHPRRTLSLITSASPTLLTGTRDHLMTMDQKHIQALIQELEAMRGHPPLTVGRYPSIHSPLWIIAILMPIPLVILLHHMCSTRIQSQIVGTILFLWEGSQMITGVGSRHQVNRGNLYFPYRLHLNSPCQNPFSLLTRSRQRLAKTLTPSHTIVRSSNWKVDFSSLRMPTCP